MRIQVKEFNNVERLNSWLFGIELKDIIKITPIRSSDPRLYSIRYVVVYRSHLKKEGES